MKTPLLWSRLYTMSSHSFQNIQKKWLSHFLYNSPTEKCWLSGCELCKNKLKLEMEQILIENYNVDIQWFAWKDVEGSLSKVGENGTVDELVGYINSCLLYTSRCV